MSLRELARLTFFSHSYLSKVEHGVKPPSIDLARRCDAVLGAEGTLVQLAGAHISAATARVRPAQTRIVQLPSGPAHFVGRDAIMRRLDDLLGDFRRKGDMAVKVLLVDGPPGVGKTALAVHWAHRIERHFDTVLFANLRGLAEVAPAQPHDVLEKLLGSLGVGDEFLPADLEGRASMFRSLVHGRKTLIILDNAAGSRQVRPLLPGMPNCVALVTSRQRLSGLMIDPGASGVTLQPLDVDSAVTLAHSLIGADHAIEHRSVLEKLVRQCGCLPLAVRIAAERAAAQPHSSVEKLVAELAAEERRLEILSTLDDETKAIRAVFSWSYHALPPQAARMFRLLSLHPWPRFTTSPAAALAGTPQVEARQLLDVLVHAHLIGQVGSDLYEFHDLLRLYATEQANARELTTERADAVRRLVYWYLHSINNAWRVLTPRRGHHTEVEVLPDGVEPLTFRDYMHAFDWCDSVLPTITGIVQLALDNGLDGAACRVPVDLFDFFSIRRPWDVWLSSNRIAIEAAQAAGDRSTLGRVLISQGEAYRRLGRHEEAESLFERALEINQDLGLLTEQGWALCGLGYIEHDQGHYAKAASLLRRMLDAMTRAYFVFGQATACVHLGRTYRELGELDKALDYGERALELYTQLDDRPAQAFALVPLARICRERAELEHAIKYCDGALDLYRQTADSWGQAEALGERANILSMLGRTSEARDDWRRAVDLFAESDERKAEEVRTRWQRFE